MKLGIHVLPAEVRTHPRREDEYKWSVLPQKEHLFEKSLSKLSTGQYTQIMQGIGVFFEALPKDPTDPCQGGYLKQSEDSAVSRGHLEDNAAKESQASADGDALEPEANFMAHITQLQNEVTSLQTEVRQWRSSAETETGQRVKLEGELERAKGAFLALHKESTTLRKDYQKARRQSSQLQVKADAWDRDVRHLMAVIHRLAAVSGTPQFAHLGEESSSE